MMMPFIMNVDQLPHSNISLTKSYLVKLNRVPQILIWSSIVNHGKASPTLGIGNSEPHESQFNFQSSQLEGNIFKDNMTGKC